MSKEQDITKIHSEINQAVNHRFLLTGAGITAFALLGRLMFLTEYPTENKELVAEVFKTVPFYFAYVSVLYLLNRQSIHLRQVIRSYSTFLIAKNWSTWEENWFCARYNSDSRIKRLAKNDVRAHSAIFCGLALFSLAIGCFNHFVLYEAELWKSVKEAINLYGIFGSFSKSNPERFNIMMSSILLLGLAINVWVLLRVFVPRFSLKSKEKREREDIEAWRNCEDICSKSTVREDLTNECK